MIIFDTHLNRHIFGLDQYKLEDFISFLNYTDFFDAYPNS